MTTLPPGMATGPAKLKAVQDIVDRLSEDLEGVSLAEPERDAALEELKIYGRDPRQADPIFSEKGLTMLLRHAFESSSQTTSHGAMRVLANAMLLNKAARQLFVDRDYPPKACAKLGEDESWDGEFLLSRIIFLTTYETSVSLADLLDKHQLAQRIVDKLGRHAELLRSDSKSKTEMMEEMALVETAKLLFNVTHFSGQYISSFTPAIAHLAALLWKHDLPATKPLDSGLSHLTNGLLNLDFAAAEAQEALFPKDDLSKVAMRLVAILDRAMRSYDDAEMDVMVTPLVGLLIKLYETAPTSTRDDMQDALLPTVEDREKVLGKGSNLPSRLLKGSTDPSTPKLGNSISHLLFDLSGKDASRFVENVGYGYASGFLFQNNISIPESASKAFDAGDGRGGQRPVNPITGQFLDTEQHIDAPEMTQEEKEREAERLFVLFERLKKNGLINVQNPVEQAVQEGRFEELSDSEDEKK
ncbi:guanine nucleotide exchange factor synembryn domain-containing protein [Sarocladium implicatum]|nr:guanine nucleotide exchange factor synembryn domain-containing protein [Sarocladium implicatum]